MTVKTDWTVHVFSGMSAVCDHADSWCVRSRQLDSQPSVTVYDCDNQHVCQRFNLTSNAALVCTNVRH
jgi:hypothetical protein